MNSSLNHIFRSIWSEALGTWIAVSEITKNKGKRSVSGLVRALHNEQPSSGFTFHLRLKPLLFALVCSYAPHALANPTGGAVVNGQASFTTSGNTLTVTNTPGTIINWQDFSIHSGEVTHFAQQSAASSVLNRVVTSNPSSILGSLQSNGRVFLVNPNGIVFGLGATVDVAGMVATTLKLSDADFLAGRNNFSEQAGAQNISNAGNITAESGGQIYLIAPNVENTGIINAPNGEILLAAGHSVELLDSSNPSLRVNITAPAGEATNVGQLVASAGNLGLFGTVVKNSGTVSASSATLQGGKIVFKASQRVEAGGTISAHGVGGGSIEVLADMQSGTVEVSGTLDASAQLSGNGGFIETSAAHVNIADSIKVSTAAAMGLAGTWLIDPVDFYVSAVDPLNGSSWMSNTVLSSNLGTGNVIIQTTAGTGNGDIFVNDSVSWSANMLTLNAHNNININATMNASGTASLALEYGQQAVAAGNASNYFLNNGAKINLPAGLNFSTRLGSDGIAKSYTVITTLGVAGSLTGSDLQGISGGLTGNYVLGSNIAATATSTWNTGAGFAPIGDAITPFIGSFDGLGHTITNLTINRTATDNVGLFGYIATTLSAIRNIGLLDASVSGQNNVGALVGASSYGTINNSYATGTVTGVSTVGGLLGINLRASVSNSHFSGSVSGTGNVGGLVGYGYGNHTIKNSYSTGTVTGGLGGTVGGLLGLLVQGTVTNSYSSANVVGGNSGGLVGWSFGSGGRIEYSYATGNVSGNLYAGGLVGAADRLAGGVTFSYSTGLVNGAGIKGGLVGLLASTGVTNSYWDTQTSGLATSAGGTGLTTAQFFSASSFTGFTFGMVGGTANQWVIVDADGTLNNAAGAAGNTRPMLLSEYTTNISSANQLQLMALNLNSNYALVANIDATATNGTSNPSGMWGSAGFVPIGNSTTQFSGTFDGLGHSISSFTINRPAAAFIGMFGYLSSAAIIRNVGLLNASVTGSNSVGGLVGYNFGGTINNSYVSGNVTGTAGTGGLVGVNFGGVISNSYTTGSVAGSTANTGGLVGSDDTGLISKSYSTASVSGGNTGGLVGNTNYGSISNSYATGNVSGSNYTGGLVGSSAFGTVSNSYATGDVSGSGHTGGLLGYNYGGGVNTSYSTGLVSVTGAGTPGGLVGVSAYGGTVTSSFWDMTTSGRTLSAGGTGYNTAQFFTASNFTGFIFNTVAGTADQWVIVDADGTLNNAASAAGATRPMLLSEYSSNISNAHQLQLMELNLSANYTLATNIDATATNGTTNPSGMWGSAGFVPIGNFTTAFNGQFDGLNHIISNLTVNQGALDNIGLFGYVTSFLGVGLIQNVGMLNVNITGGSNVGGLAGRLDAASISNSYTMGSVSGSGLNIGGVVGLSTSGTSTISSSNSSTTVIGTGTSASASVGGLVGSNQGVISSSYASGSVISSGSQVGGLAGYNQGTVTTSYASGSVNGASQVGGLAGYSFLGSISNCYATGNVTGTGSSVGGLVGDNSYSSITNSFATPVTISGGSNVGGLVGASSYGTITNSHYDIDAVSINTVNNIVTLGGLYNTGGTGQFNDWQTNNLTLNIANYSATLLPGTVNNYTINSLQGMKDLLAFADNSVYSFTLTSNIDLVSAAGYYLPVFNGLFDGAGFAISNLNVNLPGNSNIGLFGSIASTTTIQNVGLLNTSVTGANNVGGLVGNNLGGMISNSYVSGSVSASGTYGYVGGLVGSMNSGSIDKSYSTASVTGLYQVGGLVGNSFAGVISNSYATGSVTGTGTTGSVGGLVGYLFTEAAVAVISNSYAAGNVSGTTNVGGLVGYNFASSISNSYASGSVTGTVSDVGGLVGFNFGTVNNSYASGSVTGAASNIGGLAGTNDAMGTITSSFWNTQTSGLLSAVGLGISTGVTGLNTPAMMSQASFTGFDFAGTWVIYEGYTAPLLRSFMKALTVTAFDATKTYDGLAYSNINALNYSITTDANLLGTASYSSGTNAGSYVLTPSGLYSNQQGYIITYVNGALTINQAALSVSANNASKTYDSLAYSGGNGVVYSGFVNGETSAVLGGTLTYGGTAQGASNAGSYIISSGGLTSGNYAISYTNGALTINPSLTSTWNGSASYDWNDAANWNGYFIPQAGADVTIGVLAGAITFSSGSATINTLNSGTSLALNGGSFTLGSSLADASVISGASLEVNGAALTLNGSLTANTLSLVSGSVGGTGNLTVATNYSQQVAGTLGSTFNQLSLRSIGDFNLMQAYAATGGITINSGGKIVAAASGVSSYLTANNVQLTAVTGIGGATAPIMLAANNISASTTSGEIALKNSATAAVTLSNLTTGDASAVSYKQDGQALNLTGSVTSAGGNILIDPSTDLMMSTTASINSNGGAINLQASGNMALSTVNAGSGAVSIASSGGNITSALPDGQNNITASTLTARAATGIRFAYKAQSADIRSTGGTVLALNTLTGGYFTSELPVALQEIFNNVPSDAFGATDPAVDPDAAEDEEDDGQVIVNTEENNVDSSAGAAEKSLPVCQ